MFFTFTAPLSLSDEALLYLFFSLCLFISPFLHLSQALSSFCLPEGERSKCLLEEQGKLFVYTSLLLFLHSHTGGHTALIVDEMGYINVLTHMNNTKLYMSIPNFVSPSFFTVNFFFVIFSLVCSLLLFKDTSVSGSEAQSEFSVGLD